MDKTKIIITLIVIALLGGFLVYSFATSTPRESTGPRTTTQDAATLLPLQVNEEGPVSVSVQPLMSSFVGAKALWEFEVILNTHSVELTADLAEVVVLIDSLGNEYKPVKWEGDPPEGHHREASVFFDTVDTISDSITVSVRDVGGIQERNFVWTIAP